MAGHSKWANIKHRKGAQDKKRAKEFTRAIKEISVAVKEGGGPDPEANPALRNAISNAKGVNMPKDTIERAIKKASGAEADNYEAVTFEGYGPHGIAFFIECTTDNQIARWLLYAQFSLRMAAILAPTALWNSYLTGKEFSPLTARASPKTWKSLNCSS